jgi:hypothetical protein
MRCSATTPGLTTADQSAEIIVEICDALRFETNLGEPRLVPHTMKSEAQKQDTHTGTPFAVTRDARLLWREREPPVNAQTHACSPGR